jgi:hypothetical protein
MLDSFTSIHRKPIWNALSEFYLDTELDDDSIAKIAGIILESPYSMEEVKQINKYEVYPILQWNLLSTAGEWDYFDSEWLEGRIAKRLAKNDWIDKVVVDFSFPFFKWMTKGYWSRVEKVLTKNT